MTITSVNSIYTLLVPGNSGNKYGHRFGRRSRCSHLNWERWERASKLLPYLFPVFPGTGRNNL